MLESYRLVHYLRFVFGAIVVLWIFSVFGTSKNTQYSNLFRGFRNERVLFVEDFLLHDVVKDDLNSTGITELCSQKKWTPGLMLTCDAVPGGMADVKSGILTCVRIAIEMGAEVIFPDIVLRSVIDYADVVPHDVGPRRGVPLSHFFDHQHLNQSLAQYCPQLKVHASLDAFFDDPNLLTATKLDIAKLPGVELAKNPRGSGGRVLARPDKLGAAIHAYLDRSSPPRERRYPFRVYLQPTPTFLFPATSDTPAVHDGFGRLVRVREDLRRLAAAALFNLQKAFQLEIDPRKGLDVDAFVGVELRTQRDPERFPSYDVQASDALTYVVANNVSRVFLAEGATAANASAFALRAEDFHIDVVTKDDLVDGPEAAALARLSYDERFLVDYEILLRAGLFAGSAHSSFAWNLALRRQHAFGDPGRANASHLNSTAVRWHDQYSTLYGGENAGENMRVSIWP